MLQYDKAVRKLRKYLKKNQPSSKAALICCASFYCFESARGDFDNAREHLSSGFKILQRTYADRFTKETDIVTDSPEDLNMLGQRFSRLDLQATMFHHRRTPFLSMATDDGRSGATPIVRPTAFANLDEAQLTLDKLQNQVFRFLTTNNPYKYKDLEDLPTAIVHEKSELVRQYTRWSNALKALKEQQKREPAVLSGDSAKILEMHQRTSQMLLLASFPEDSTVFGAYHNPRAEEILDLAESLSRTMGKDADSTSANRPMFSAEMGIVAPLSMLGIKCHNPQICEEATKLLATSHKREGLIDAQMVAGIVQRTAILRERQAVTPLMAELAQLSW